MKRTLFAILLLLVLLPSCTKTTESHYTLFMMCIDNQTQDSLMFTSKFSTSYLLKPGDTTMTNLAVSTDLDLLDVSRNAIWSDLKSNFMSRSFDTCYVNNLLDVSDLSNRTKMWTKPFVDTDTIHNFFNANDWKMLYNVKGRNILLFTITNADSVSTTL
jgi:hypothetical protein